MISREITRATLLHSASSVFQDLRILKDTVIKHHRFNFSKDATVNILSSAVGLSLLILRLVNVDSKISIRQADKQNLALF